MSNTPDTPSPADAEADAERARAGLVNTLNQLRENLKPANVVDEVMSNAKVSASAITDQVWDTARKNPLPALMIGAGLAMIFGLGARTVGAGPAAPRPASPPVRTPGSDWARASPSIDAKTAGGLDLAKGRAANLLDTANQQLTGAASRGADRINQAFKKAKGPDPMSSLNLSRDQLGQSVNRLLDEQPLILAAIGVAVGAAIGAALPQTQRENSLMGETSHSLRDAATSLAQDQLKQLKTVAGNAVEDLKQTAADRGVSADNLSGLVRDVGEKTKSAAYEAGRVVNPET